MNEKYNIEDKHEIASIINRCLDDGYCDASMLARRITQAGYGNNNRVRNEFAEKLKGKFKEFDSRWIVYSKIDELLKEYKNEQEK